MHDDNIWTSTCDLIPPHKSYQLFAQNRKHGPIGRRHLLVMYLNMVCL
jgi:hypothetical protein